jgi:type II secretory pathway component PulC
MKSFLISVSLMGLCSWLGWTAYEEAQRPTPSVTSRSLSAAAQTDPDGDSPAQKKAVIEFPLLEDLDEIVSRPLFNTSRRPIVVEDEPQPVAKPTDLNVMLSGIVIGQTRQIAHLRSLTEKETQALSVGDKIDGWEIQSIFPDHVVLKSGSRVESLYMQKPGVKPPSARNRRATGTRPTTRRATTSARQRARQKRLRNQRNRRGGTQ